MKFILLLLIASCVLIGCREEKLTNKEVAHKYFEARDSRNFDEIKPFVNDSIVVVEGDFIMPYSQESFYEVFKWDSVFQTSYKLVDLKEVDNQVIAGVALTSIRNEFLKNDSMTCEFKLSFDAGKISKIESLACQNADWKTWQEEVETLVSWIDINHPELNGFINDMSRKGAQKYLEAIELYKASQQDF